MLPKCLINIFFIFQCLAEIDKWGIDIFRIGDLSNNRPLTAVAFQAFQVSTNIRMFPLQLIVYPDSSRFFFLFLESRLA